MGGGEIAEFLRGTGRQRQAQARRDTECRSVAVFIQRQDVVAEDGVPGRRKARDHGALSGAGTRGDYHETVPEPDRAAMEAKTVGIFRDQCLGEADHQAARRADGCRRNGIFAGEVNEVAILRMRDPPRRLAVVVDGCERPVHRAGPQRGDEFGPVRNIHRRLQTLEPKSHSMLPSARMPMHPRHASQFS